MKLLIAVLAVPLLAQQRGVNFYSIEKERALGESLARDIRQQSPPLANPEVDEYVSQVGAQIVAQLREPQYPYTFEVIVSETAEPIAVPGGHLLVPAQFLLAVQNEAEFASMLAHVIAHVALRHGTRAVTRGQLVNTASIPLVYMGGWSGSHAVSNQAARVLIPVGMLQFQRSMETEADQLGVELASRAGYNAAAYRNYIQRVQLDESKPVFSPLPTREARIAKLNEFLRDVPTELPPSSVAFIRARDSVREALKRPEPKPPTLRRQ